MIRVHFFGALLFFFSTSLFSNTLLKVKLEKGEKVEETFSTELEHGSLHLLFIKNKKLSHVGLRTFYVDAKMKVVEMEKVFYPKVPVVLSFHQTEEHIFLFTFLEKKLTKIKLNPLDGTLEKIVVSGVKRPEYVLRNPNKTIFIRPDSENEEITIEHFSNSINADLIKEKIKKNHMGKDNWIFTKPFVSVNTSEFVDKGSISNRKIYLEGSLLTFTFLDDKTINYHSWNLKDSSSYQGVFDIATQSTSRNVNSFVHGKHIYRVDTQKEQLKITILDMINGEEEASLESDTELAYIFSDSKSTRHYFKEIWKKAIKPTIAVNMNTEGNPIVRLSSANTATYNYYYDWWYHHFVFQHQIQMQMMQQQAIQNIPGFQPSPDYYEEIGVIYNSEDEDTRFEFVLNSKYEPIPEGNMDTEFPTKNKEKYLKPFKSNSFLKHLTAAFTNSQMRYIFFHKSMKTVFLDYQRI